MAAALAFVGGTIETMDRDGRVACAAAVADGRFVAVGSEAEVRARCDARTEIVDLAGATMLPGFIDTHMHLEKIAREMAMLQFDAVTGLDELLALTAQAAREARPGEWVRSFGDDRAWHESSLREGRLPTRAELDAVAPEHPVYLYRGPDAAALNSAAAAALAGALAEGEGWEAASGHVRGRLARTLEASLPAASPARERERLEEAGARLLSMGVTSVVDPGLPGRFERSWEHYEAARGLRQRLYLMNRLDPAAPFEDELARVEGARATPGQGDDRLRAWSLKMILDGEFANAWMRPGEEVGAGAPLVRYTPAQLAAAVELCARRGWPLCVHAMGGAAIGAVIDAVAAAAARGLALPPAAVSLAHAFLISPEDVERCRELGIALSVHPMLAYVFEAEMLEAWGERAHAANPLATILRAGAAVAGGSDTLPCEPLRGARYAVDRRSRDGAVLGPGEAIGARDALSLFTRRAAGYVLREDLGVIEPGALADLAIWEADPLTQAPEDWLDIPLRLAAVGGAIAWAA